MDTITIKMFDQVKIITTKNVAFLSAPKDAKLSPHGIWSVSGVIGDDLLLTKNNVVIRIPATDVLVEIEYNLDTVAKNLGNLSHGKKDRR